MPKFYILTEVEASQPATLESAEWLAARMLEPVEAGVPKDLENCVVNSKVINGSELLPLLFNNFTKTDDEFLAKFYTQLRKRI